MSEFTVEWPKWMHELDSTLSESLVEISTVHLRLCALTDKPYHYRHVLQAQLNALSDKMFAEGVLSKDIVQMPYGRANKLNKTLILGDAITAALINDQATVCESLETLSFVTRVSLVKLLDAACMAAQDDNLLVSFICFRALLENIGHYHLLLKNIAKFIAGESFDEAKKAQGEILELLFKFRTGTRVNWELLCGPDADKHIDRQTITYNKEDARIDRTAGQVLKGVDALDKSCRGTRGIYEILCEFAHPNVGMLLLCTEDAHGNSDPNGTLWVDKKLSSKMSQVAFLKRPILRIFKQVSACLQIFESDQAKAGKERMRLLTMVQIIIRQLLSNKDNRRLFNPYGPCPCGSGKKLKFCCTG